MPPPGSPMIDLHYAPTPNGWKITIMLEECGLPYAVHPMQLGRGDQHQPEFLKLSPNGRMPAIVDRPPAGRVPPIAPPPPRGWRGAGARVRERRHPDLPGGKIRPLHAAGDAAAV